MEEGGEDAGSSQSQPEPGSGSGQSWEQYQYQLAYQWQANLWISGYQLSVSEDKIQVTILVLNNVLEEVFGHDTYKKFRCCVCPWVTDSHIWPVESYAAKEKPRDKLNLTIFEMDAIYLV